MQDQHSAISLPLGCSSLVDASAARSTLSKAARPYDPVDALR